MFLKSDLCNNENITKIVQSIDCIVNKDNIKHITNTTDIAQLNYIGKMLNYNGGGGGDGSYNDDDLWW